MAGAGGDKPGRDPSAGPGAPSGASSSAPSSAPGAAPISGDEPYRALFDRNPMPMWVYDPATLGFLDVNQAAIDRYGYARAEFLTMTLADIRPAEDMPRLRALIGKLKNGTLHIGRWRHRVKSGELIDVDVSWMPLESGGRRRVLAVIRDVTEAIRTEAALREVEARFQAVVQNAPLALSIKDTAGRYQFCNPEALRALNALGKPYLGKTARELIGDAAAHAEAEDRRILQTGEPSVSEADLPAGTPFERTLMVKFPIRNASGVIVAIGAFAIDITKQRRAELALRSSEQRFERIVNLVEEGIWIHDQGIITFANPAAARLFGADDPGELVGRSIFAMLHPEDRKRAEERTRHLIGDHAPLPTMEMRIIGLDGRLRIAELQAVPLQQGDRVLAIASGRDVTEQRAREAQLQQALKMEAVGQLTGGVAHDFNNLLTIIIGALDVDPGKIPAELRPWIDQALRAAERGAALTHRLLAFSRQQTLNPGPVDFNRLVAGMDDLLRRSLGEEVDIELDLAPHLWPALADAAQVENALLNLAINARDAMPEGGKLTIETANAPLDADYAAINPGVMPGDYVMLAVSDTGSGMTPEVLAHAFEPFFTTKEVGKGTGLGLSMVYGFAKQSGGHALIYSEIGYGTTVRLYLPRLMVLAGQMEDLPAPPRAAPGGGETILVVEDDGNLRALVLRQLRDLGYRVIEAANGKAALEVIDSGEAIDLLFTDVVMPGGMTGRQLADAARARRPHLKALFTSGYAEGSIQHRGALEPGLRLLSKPYRKQVLATRIREALDG